MIFSNITILSQALPTEAGKPAGLHGAASTVTGDEERRPQIEG